MEQTVRRGGGCGRPLLAVVVGIALLTAAGAAWSQSIAKPVATVRLHTPEIISSRQFAAHLDLAARLSGVALTPADCRPALDQLINQHVYLQEAVHRRLIPTEAEIDADMTARRRQTEQTLGRDRRLTDDEWRGVIQRETRLSLEEFRDRLAAGLSLQRLVAQMHPELLQGIEPANAQEIFQFYNLNLVQFVQPEMALVQHIHFGTTGLDEAGIEQARGRADEVLRELRAGASFDDLVVKYSDDSTSRYRGGELGNRYIRRDDQRVIETLGAPFLEAAFALAVGETSGVVASNIGFHILRVADRIAPRLLTLDDPVTPRSQMTVRQQIGALLDTRRQSQAYLQAVEETVQELREHADVRVFEENVCQ